MLAMTAPSRGGVPQAGHESRLSTSRPDTWYVVIMGHNPSPSTVSKASTYIAPGLGGKLMGLKAETRHFRFLVRDRFISKTVYQRFTKNY